MISMILALGFTGCVADISNNKVVAEAHQAQKEAAPTSKGWAIDPSASTMKALAAKVSAIHPINFGKFSGSVTVTDGVVEGIRFEVDMRTLEADQPKLTAHLKKPDFFDVAKFPVSTFVSTSLQPGASSGVTEVTGNLTIHGQSRSVTFPAQISVEPALVRANTEFAIDRQDFGVSYPGMKDDLIQDKVVLTVAFVAKKGA